MELERLLRNFVKDYCNNADFEFDATYGSVLSMDDGSLQIKIEPHENEAWLHCAIFDLPKHKREKMYEALLTTQLFGQLTRGAHFSLNMNEQKILLCKSIKIENMPQEDFDALLKEFFETSLLYQATLKHFE